MNKTMRKIVWFICYILYYGIAQHLPVSPSRPFGPLAKKIRYILCKGIFKKCGKNVNVEHKASFGYGRNIEIGDNSGIGVNCFIPDGSIIGKDVMMGPNCYVHVQKHRFDRTDIPMRLQGYYQSSHPVLLIEDDVWIGRDVTILTGRTISKGSIIGANCVLTKDFPQYSIVAGNPGRLIRLRK
jgi:maltose O-acetyltransferase